MPTSAWNQLLHGAPWFHGEGQYPIAAYSEFIPAPRLAVKPYSKTGQLEWEKSNPWGWPITEFEEAFEFRPGQEHLAQQIVRSLARWGSGHPAHGIARGKLVDNPYWPPELAEHAGKLSHERYIVLLPLVFSRTQDDKGRLRWTLFGGSERGPGKAFWKGFFTAPRREASEDQGPGFIRRLLNAAYDEPMDKLGDLRGVGFRILDQGHQMPF